MTVGARPDRGLFKGLPSQEWSRSGVPAALAQSRLQRLLRPANHQLPVDHNQGPPYQPRLLKHERNHLIIREAVRRAAQRLERRAVPGEQVRGLPAFNELSELVFAELVLEEVSFFRFQTLFVEPRSHLAAGRSAAPPVQRRFGHFCNLRPFYETSEQPSFLRKQTFA